MSAPFRQGLTARKLTWAVGIPRHLKVYPADVQMTWPVAGRGRPRRRPVPDVLSIAAESHAGRRPMAEHLLAHRNKGKLKARFAAVRVRVADGPPQRIWDKGQQHLPGDEAWLIGEHRMSGEKKYYLANLPAKTDSARLGGDHQGAMDLRAGPPAAERGTRSRSLRGSLLARPPPPCAHDDDCLRLPPASPSRSSTAEKKRSAARRLSRPCQPCATPSSNSSFDHRRIAEMDLQQDAA